MKQIICPECAGTFAPADFTMRPIDGHPRLKNVGMSCPHCGWFGHLFVEDMRLRRRRTTVAQRRQDYNRKPTPGKWRDVEKAKTELGRVFDEVQARWRPVLGLVPISTMTDGEASDR